MAELFEEVVALLESRSSTRALANRFRIGSQQAAGNGVVLCVPILIAELSHLADDSVKSAPLLKTLRSIDTFGLNDPGAAIEGNLYEPIGSRLTDTLLGDRRASIVDLISAEAGIGRQSADCLLPPAAWTILTTIADRYGSRMGQQSLADVLAHEVDGLFNAGWGSWLEAVGSYGAEVQPDDGYGDDPYGDRYGQPESDQDRYGMSEAHDIFGEYGQHELPTDGAYLQRTRYGDHERYGTVAGYGDYGQDPDRGPADDYSRYGARGPGGVPAPEIARRSALQSGGGSVGLGSQRRSPSAPVIAERIPEEAAPSRIPLVLAAVAVVLLGILAATQLVGGDSGVGDDGTTTAIGLGDTGDDLGENDQVGPDPFGEGTQDQDDGLVANSVALDLIVSDPQGLSGSVGSLQLRFDLDAEEVCYNVTADLLAAPYDGHIHAGPLGQSGEVVVGFGLLNNGDFGCTQVDRASLNEILNDRPNFYVDLHDVTGVESIRAQLSEATDANGQPGSGTGGGIGTPAGVQYDPRGDGAFFRMEAGRLVMTGSVADQETADRIVAEFADIAGSGLDVVSELTVAADAPAPSGRFTMNNVGLFQLGSDQLAADRGSVIIDLASVLAARPTWRVTVIGHTDATGSEELNLSLSLGRAMAVLDELVANGVAQDKVSADGAGSSQPVADNATPEGQAQNRRIEVIVDRG